MKKEILAVLFLLAHLVLGLMLILGAKQLSSVFSIHSSFLICLVLLLLNLAYVYALKLQQAKSIFWNWRKLHFLFIGLIVGAAIAFIPLLLGALATYSFYFQDLIFSSLGITFFIVGWEELWFRSIILNYCNRRISTVKLSLIVGLLFLAFHLLNPNIDLWKTGMNLFFAGALLTLLYFYYQTIWLPIGIHFGNNLLGSIAITNAESKLFFGEDGLISTITLAIVFLIFVKKTRKKEAKRLTV